MSPGLINTFLVKHTGPKVAASGMSYGKALLEQVIDESKHTIKLFVESSTVL